MLNKIQPKVAITECSIFWQQYVSPERKDIQISMSNVQRTSFIRSQDIRWCSTDPGVLKNFGHEPKLVQSSFKITSWQLNSIRNIGRRGKNWHPSTLTYFGFWTPPPYSEILGPTPYFVFVDMPPPIFSACNAGQHTSIQHLYNYGSCWLENFSMSSIVNHFIPTMGEEQGEGYTG